MVEDADFYDDMEIEKLVEMEAMAMARKRTGDKVDISMEDTAMSVNVNRMVNNVRNVDSDGAARGINDHTIQIEERLLEEENDVEIDMDIPIPPSPPHSQNNYIDLLTPPSLEEIGTNNVSKKEVDDESDDVNARDLDGVELSTPSPLPSSSPPGNQLLTFQRIEEEINDMLKNDNSDKLNSYDFVINAVTKKIIKFTCKKTCIVAVLTVIDTGSTQYNARFHSDLCEEIIGMTASEYRKKEKTMSKEEKTAFKLEVCKLFKKLDKPLLYTIRYDSDPDYAHTAKTEDLNGSVSPIRSEGDGYANNSTANSLTGTGSQKAWGKHPLLIIAKSDPEELQD